MIEYESMVEDDEIFGEDDESYFVEDDESDDDFAERRRRGGGRRPPRIRVGRTGTGKNLMTKTAPKGAVSTASLQASLERVGRDIRANAAAIKSLGEQVKTATSNLTSVNNKQDASIADLRADLKKQGGASSQQNQLNMLVPLLQKTPEIELRPGGDAESGNAVIRNVQVKKQDNTLPLLITMMGSMQPGAGGNNQMNMMLPLLLLIDK